MWWYMKRAEKRSTEQELMRQQGLTSGLVVSACAVIGKDEGFEADSVRPVRPSRNNASTLKRTQRGYGYDSDRPCKRYILSLYPIARRCGLIATEFVAQCDRSSDLDSCWRDAHKLETALRLCDVRGWRRGSFYLRWMELEPRLGIGMKTKEEKA